MKDSDQHCHQHSGDKHPTPFSSSHLARIWEHEHELCNFQHPGYTIHRLNQSPLQVHQFHSPDFSIKAPCTPLHTDNKATSTLPKDGFSTSFTDGDKCHHAQLLGPQVSGQIPERTFDRDRETHSICRSSTPYCWVARMLDSAGLPEHTETDETYSAVRQVLPQRHIWWGSGNTVKMAY